MFVLGHSGIGTFAARPLIRPGTLRWALLGTLLPDLVDKPVYYGLAFATGKRAAELGLISGTRTFGHTLLFAILMFALVRGPRGAALAVGLATHLLLDLGGDGYGWVYGHLFGPGGLPAHPGPTTLAAVFFPLLGPHFPISPFQTVGDHVLSIASAWTVFGELAGAALLYWQHRRGLLGELSLSSFRRAPASPRAVPSPPGRAGRS